MGEGANLRGLGAIVRGARGPLVISFVLRFFFPLICRMRLSLLVHSGAYVCGG